MGGNGGEAVVKEVGLFPSRKKKCNNADPTMSARRL